MGPEEITPEDAEAAAKEQKRRELTEKMFILEDELSDLAVKKEEAEEERREVVEAWRRREGELAAADEVVRVLEEALR
ncbi:hypothetical protein BO78DRAFT_433743, partial [Aspergillus sclerotiicarbonarius CBS 121057]